MDLEQFGSSHLRISKDALSDSSIAEIVTSPAGD
jgi:hypothetical protein